MQVSLSGHHVDITESLRNYVNEKVARLDRHFDKALDIQIVLTVEKLRHKAEATLLDIGRGDPSAMKEPPPQVVFRENEFIHSGSSVFAGSQRSPAS